MILKLTKNLKPKLRKVSIECALNIFILKVLRQITNGHFDIGQTNELKIALYGGLKFEKVRLRTKTKVLLIVDIFFLIKFNLG